MRNLECQAGYISSPLCPWRRGGIDHVRNGVLPKYAAPRNSHRFTMTARVCNRVALRIEYNGSSFHGWERKPGLRTVQGTVEDALGDIVGAAVRTVAASKTDAGTHAVGQVLHFDSARNLSGNRAWEKALNSRLPHDVIVVQSAQSINPSFNARTDAIWRRYRYTLYTSPVPSLFLSGLSWHVYQYPIEESAMNKAARMLLERGGSADMSAFRKSRSAAAHTRINVMDALVVRNRPHVVEIEVTADWFVYGMMRLLTAALVEVGRGSWSLADFRRVLEQGDRSAVKHSAPAAGLCLLEVGYMAEKYPFRGSEVPNLAHHGLSDVKSIHP